MAVTNNNGFWIGFINSSQVLTTSNCNTIADFHFTNHSTLIFSVCFHQSSISVSWQRIYNTTTIKVSLNYTFPISLYYSTCKVIHCVFLEQSNSFDCRLPEFWSVTTDSNWSTLTPISSQHGPCTENTALWLLHACLLGFPCDR
jgi:hypothetical protein